MSERKRGFSYDLSSNQYPFPTIKDDSKFVMKMIADDNTKEEMNITEAVFQLASKKIKINMER